MRETAIVSAISQYLQYQENLGNLFFIRNNSGAVRMGKRFVRFGKKGSSDFIIFMSGNGDGPGKTIFLEVKTESGKLTQHQKDFEIKIIKLGYEYHIVRNVIDVGFILEIA